MGDDEQRAIGRLEGTVDAMRREQGEMHKKLDLALSRPCQNADKCEEREVRIRSLETARAVSTGWIAGALAAGAFLGMVARSAADLWQRMKVGG